MLNELFKIDLPKHRELHVQHIVPDEDRLRYGEKNAIKRSILRSMCGHLAAHINEQNLFELQSKKETRPERCSIETVYHMRTYVMSRSELEAYVRSQIERYVGSYANPRRY